MQAMLAAEAVVAHYVIMACYRIALAPESDPAAAARARANAAALTRTRLANLRELRGETRPARAAAAEPPARRKNPMHRDDPHQPAPPARGPLPPHPQFQPRDRFGAPIPLWRSQDMTMAQRRATYAAAEPREVREEAVAEALAEEATMIAEEAARQAAEAPTVPA
jgi:hypothetical protein